MAMRSLLPASKRPTPSFTASRWSLVFDAAADHLVDELRGSGARRHPRLPIHDIRRVCPECVILPSDYETYGLMSLRMYEIVRRFTSIIVEYSIDECFADLTGLSSPLTKSFAARLAPMFWG